MGRGGETQIEGFCSIESSDFMPGPPFCSELDVGSLSAWAESVLSWEPCVCGHIPPLLRPQSAPDPPGPFLLWKSAFRNKMWTKL